MAAITAIGTANPNFSQAQSDVASFMSKAFGLNKTEARRLQAIYRATGIERRYSVISDYCEPQERHHFFKTDGSLPSTKQRMALYKEHALPLALTAVHDCFSSNDDEHGLNCNSVSNTVRNTITHIITVSCTGMYAPGLDIEIIHALNLPFNTQRTAVNFMGCYGVFNALKLADAICKSNQAAKVLIVSVELCSLHIQNARSVDDIISGAIFSDGAAAMIVESEGNREKHSEQRPNKYFKLDHFYCDLIPEGKRHMTWAIADQGFDIVLSSYVPALIETGIGKFFEQNVAVQRSFIDIFAIHPGGSKILEVCEKVLGIRPEQNEVARKVLRNYGNMSSATIVFLLKDLWNHKETLHNKTIFSCAFGPGLTVESALLQVSLE